MHTKLTAVVTMTVEIALDTKVYSDETSIKNVHERAVEEAEGMLRRGIPWDKLKMKDASVQHILLNSK